MPATTSPNTTAIADAIVAFGQALTYPNTSTLVYKAVAKGELKDVIDLVAGGAVCLEVYANLDDSQRHAFGGKIWDEQSWFLLSMVSLDNAQTAETLIHQVRDALVVPFQQHATLGDAGSVFHAQIKPNTGKFFKIFRNAQWLRSHVLEIMTKQEWFVPPPGIVS